MISSAMLAWPVFLTGFMGSGKSTVGRALAGDLGIPFIDLDQVVAGDAGKSIEEIFAEDGEAEFRSLETAALARVAAGLPAVVATGGGVVSRPENIRTMRRSGLVLALDASLAELERRVVTGSSRPLWGDAAAREELFSDRASLYRQAHATVRTDERGITEVVRAASRLVTCAMALGDDELRSTTFVCTDKQDYAVVVRSGGLQTIGYALNAVLGEGARVAVITDDNVAGYYRETLVAALSAADIDVACIESVPPGETSKSLARFGDLCERLVAAGADRRSIVVSLGGGVVGDLAGYVAASLFRGVRVVQLPTSLLAMIDSSVGGKTGINIAAGKNLVGAFWQPELVYADPDVLMTLAPRERRAAFGEMLKYGLLDGEELFAAITALADGFAGDTLPEDSRWHSQLTDVITRCVMYKAWVVARDEREQTGVRALLNLGHTVGHAIEAAEGYRGLVHGEAVALGLLAACRVSAALGQNDGKLESRVGDALTRAGLSTALDGYLREDVLERVKVDKKRTGTTIGFITVEQPGGCRVTHITPQELSRILRA